MRKTFLTQEYTRENVSAFLNTNEQRMFLASKILHTPNTIIIDDNDISYMMTTSGVNQYTQNIDIEVESFYNVNNKEINKVLKNNTITINIKELFFEYVYANIMRSRIFQNILNSDTKSNVKDMIYDYISDNIYKRYRFVNINLYIEFVPNITPILKDTFIKTYPLGNETTVEYKARSNAYKNSYLVKNYQISNDVLFETATVTFKNDDNLGYNYYFDVIYQLV